MVNCPSGATCPPGERAMVAATIANSPGDFTEIGQAGRFLFQVSQAQVTDAKTVLHSGDEELKADVRFGNTSVKWLHRVLVLQQCLVAQLRHRLAQHLGQPCRREGPMAPRLGIWTLETTQHSTGTRPPASAINSAAVCCGSSWSMTSALYRR
jgi:hypothetical protein